MCGVSEERVESVIGGHAVRIVAPRSAGCHFPRPASLLCPPSMIRNQILHLIIALTHTHTQESRNERMTGEGEKHTNMASA